MRQQKDTEPEEYKRMHSEKEVHLKNIKELREENIKLKAEVARGGGGRDVCRTTLSTAVHVCVLYLLVTVG